MKSERTATFVWQATHFDLDQIAESGQVFRWQRLGPEKYAIPAGDQFCTAWHVAPDLLAVRCPENKAAFWQYYFGVGDAYPEYWAAIATWAERDGPAAYLSRAAAAANGMVILHQPAWETMVSFMVSQNNNIPRIKATLAAMCRRFGKLITTPTGEQYYTFPEAETLTDVAELAGLGLGYRDKYIAALAHSVMAGALPITAIEAMDYNEAKNVLKSVQGIGEKVANCVLLYGMGHLEAFPVDTWIRRVLDREFSDGFPMERYAGFAGLIQQLIFYYER
ncbi:MAG: hypothetical protein RRY97_09325, partial [Oscillibacter sp.]